MACTLHEAGGKMALRGIERNSRKLTDHVKHAFVRALAVLVLLLGARTSFAEDSGYDVVVSGEGPVGLFAALKIKRENPKARVALFEKRSLDRTGRPNVPIYAPEVLAEFKKVGLDPHGFAPINQRVVVATDKSQQHFSIDANAHETAHYEPYNPMGLVEKKVARAQAIGTTEKGLRELAQQHGVEIHYESEVVAAQNQNGGIELTVKGEDGASRVIRAKVGLLADGSRGLGSKLAGTKPIGSVPMMAAATNVAGNGTLENHKFAESSAPEGHVVAIKIGAETGTAFLAEVPPSLEAAPEAQKQAWFFKQAKRLGLGRSAFTDASGKETAPSSFPAYLSHGKTGEGRLFFVGDAAGTVPIITGSGVNKGILQVVDSASTIGQVLREPAHADRLLAEHHAREDAAQEKLFDGFTHTIGPRLRPMAPTAAAAAAAPTAQASSTPPKRALKPTTGRTSTHHDSDDEEKTEATAKAPRTGRAYGQRNVRGGSTGVAATTSSSSEGLRRRPSSSPSRSASMGMRH